MARIESKYLDCIILLKYLEQLSISIRRASETVQFRIDPNKVMLLVTRAVKHMSDKTQEFCIVTRWIFVQSTKTKHIYWKYYD